jgi:hypothetical protein
MDIHRQGNGHTSADRTDVSKIRVSTLTVKQQDGTSPKHAAQPQPAAVLLTTIQSRRIHNLNTYARHMQPSRHVYALCKHKQTSGSTHHRV